MISQLEDDGGKFAVGLLKELARAYLTATSSDNTRAQVWPLLYYNQTVNFCLYTYYVYYDNRILVLMAFKKYYKYMIVPVQM